MEFVHSLRNSATKVVASRYYTHVDSIDSLEPSLRQLAQEAIDLVGRSPGRDFNVVRVDERDQSVALLDYPTFDSEACPRLQRSWKVTLRKAAVSFRTYSESLNPPILHRKELLLAIDDPRRTEWSALTQQLESLGVFDDPVKIGFQNQWRRLLTERGFQLSGNQLVAIGNDESSEAIAEDTVESAVVARYRTALTRYTFSAPVQLLRKFGLIQSSKTVFDYGCGKGDDLRGLIEQGVSAGGWDPHFAAEQPVYPADLVNLGFVINVIEDPAERREALTRAYSLSKEILAVSAMLANDNAVTGTPFADGVLTKRRTFQKYYTQLELRQYIETTLNQEAVPVAPGIFFVFQDKEAQQRFQLERARGAVRLPRLANPLPRAGTATVIKSARRPPKPSPYESHRELLERLWLKCLELGRRPDPSELTELQEIEDALGSLNKALQLVIAHQDSEMLQKVAAQRRDDLCVYFAMQFFSRRTHFAHLGPGLQKDVRIFFGSYATARDTAHALLLASGSPERIREACTFAIEQGLGWLHEDSALQLHTQLLSRLPAILRVYVGCAATLYGDAADADLVKIHIDSGKVTFMKFDLFLESALPRMKERVKINLRTQYLQRFEYGADYPPPLLFLKSRYLNEELPHYAEQLSFDEQIQSLADLDLAQYGPSEVQFNELLKSRRLWVSGFQLVRNHFIPALDDPCGRYLTYRQLIECGETQQATHLTNLPIAPESYTALYELATQILDPVIEYFGMIKLTYGFCSPQLARKIPNRIDPRIDQHSAHEINRAGKPVCARLGAAVDFLVEDENMQEVLDWMISQLPFDRIYFYGPDRPLHVSYGPERNGEVVEMKRGPSGRLIPRVIRRKRVAVEEPPNETSKSDAAKKTTPETNPSQ